jgi:hypothetical protein
LALAVAGNLSGQILGHKQVFLTPQNEIEKFLNKTAFGEEISGMRVVIPVHRIYNTPHQPPLLSRSEEFGSHPIAQDPKIMLYKIQTERGKGGNLYVRKTAGETEGYLLSHLSGCPTGEGESQDGDRIDTLGFYQMNYPLDNYLGLAGPRPGYHYEAAMGVADHFFLKIVESLDEFRFHEIKSILGHNFLPVAGV